MNKHIIRDILKSVDKSPGENPKPIHIITGMFGSGKSAAIKDILTDIRNKTKPEGIVIINDLSDSEYITDLMPSLKILQLNGDNYENLKLNEQNSEQEFNRKHYRELIESLKEQDKELADHYAYYKKSRSLGEKLILDMSDPEENISNLIEELIPKKSDQRLLNHTEDVCSESFIVDLMNIYYPMDNEEPEGMKSLMPIKPAKIVFILDDHHTCEATINSWLFNSLLEYVFHRSFSEFINYDITDNDDRIRVNQFFDFRFIITGREDVGNQKFYPSSGNFKERMKVHHLKKLLKKDAEEFLTANNAKIDTDIDNLLSISFGLPGMIMLWSEYYLLDDVGDDTSIVYNRAATQILEFKSDREKEWIRCASFLDEFDSNGLRCFPEINKDHKIAFEYFSFFSELASKGKDRNSLQLREEIREIVSRSIASKSERIYNEYQKIAEQYKKARELFIGLDDKEIEVFRNMAYFKKFDKKCILHDAFDSDYELAVKFINDHPQFFDTGKFSMSLKPEIREILNEFNKRVDLGKYSEKKVFVNSILEENTKRMREAILENDDKIQNLNREMKDIKVNMNPKKSINESLQRKYIDKENERIELKKKLSNLKYKSNLFTSLINLGIAVLIFFIAYYLPDFYEGVGINKDSKTVEIILFITSGIFAAASFIYSVRSLSSRMKKTDRLKAEKRLKLIEKEKAENHTEMKKLKEESTMLQNRIKEIEKELDSLRSENSDNRVKLSEEYV